MKDVNNFVKATSEPMATCVQRICRAVTMTRRSRIPNLPLALGSRRTSRLIRYPFALQRKWKMEASSRFFKPVDTDMIVAT